MSFIKRLFDFYINASVHVALAVVAFTYITSLSFNYVLDLNLAIVIFCSTIIGYNFVKYAGIAKFHYLSLTKNLQLIQLFSLVVFITLLFFIFNCSWQELLLLVFISLLTIAYAIPFLPKAKNLRTIKGLKIFIIALVWTLTTVLLPLVNSIIIIDFHQLCFFSLHRFVLILILLIPFEIRDVNYDDAQLKTLPQMMGVQLSKAIGIFLVFAQLGLAIGFSLNYNLFILIFISVILLLAIIASDLIKSNYFTSYYVESIPILWYLSELLIK
ncbi:hypothetical protein [Psychroflexus sp. ALD_RP9]|uniref:hypothetical protein n=1 Tax=Psychroflexus sp. ALD_RP9 TaxID=2777186 RepID=UPI001A8F4C04|nr:hypothetical protein [Psychroflexus sp. ALD_RP9]QSS96375.1 hypothetical protein IMZ30_07870 [Psychroflexus sp. ALD_RP9]